VGFKRHFPFTFSRARAEDRVTLRPRSEREIQSALEREVEAERWTNLDRALRDAADEGAGIADLRPGGPRQRSRVETADGWPRRQAGAPRPRGAGRAGMLGVQAGYPRIRCAISGFGETSSRPCIGQ
jgi:hypothetical protein